MPEKGIHSQVRAQATLILLSLLLAGQEGATTAPREKSSGAQQQHVYVVERQLLPVHEHIIVGLPGLWAVTSPDSAALRAHFFLRVRTLLCMSGCNCFAIPVHP